MRIVLIGMRRSRSDQLRQLIGAQASAVLRAEDAPAVFQPAPADVRRLMNVLAPSLVAFDPAQTADALAGQLERAGRWLDDARDIALVIGHVSAAEAAAAALLASQDVDAALDDWMADAGAVLGFIESRSSKALLVNVRAAVEAPADLGFQFEMRFARNLFRDTPAPGVQEDDIASVLVPAAKAFIDARPDVEERDAELMNVATLRERAFGSASTDRVLRSTRALHRHFERLEAGAHTQHQAELSSDLERRLQDASDTEAGLKAKIAGLDRELSESRRRVRELEAHIIALEDKLMAQDGVMRRDLVAVQREAKRLQSLIDSMEATLWWRAGAPFRHVYAAIRNALSAKSKVRQQIELVRSDGLFSETWYLARYRDTIPRGADAAEHFVLNGWAEQKSPGPGFDIVAYLEDNPDVAGVGVNPFLHYITSGRDEGRPVRAVREQYGNMSGGPHGG